jgi:adenine-specific DNA-methyltransferase
MSENKTERFDEHFTLNPALTEQEKLQAVFPECFAEGKLNIDKLLALCGEHIDVDENDREKYEFRWKGKADALKLLQGESSGTLRPKRDESVDFDATRNIYIKGDNLESLKILLKSYYRKAKICYLDPPYNVGGDFVYNDSFGDGLANYKQITSQAANSSPESDGRYHTRWLNMMYPRIYMAKNLLTDDGVIFISIDDHEIDNLKKLCNEVFGEDNFVAQTV